MRSGLKFWLLTLFALLGAAATLSLGVWQLSRAAEKLALQAAIERKASLPALDDVALLALSNPLEQAMHQKILLHGRWLADRTLFLDNRPMSGKTGFYVVTPFALSGSDKVVLVQRGWVQRNFVDRASVPSIETPAGEVDIKGLISPPPSKLYELGGAESGIIRQNLDMAQYRAETGLALLPVSVRQTGDAGDGLERDWPQISLGVSKNYGYAFQWFGLSALIAILYVWFQIVRRFFIPRRT